ncbi:hypothetical protein [Phenylobacterium sp.]|uniref:hypothetical protein n=1 Tax=Phenylobacterium sp. TaxID=1871053 RepID=UPI0035B03CBB
MSVSEMRELSPKPLTPEALIGAASPLWGFFAGAAATGVAFWWFAQWSRPTNLEALFGRSSTVVSPELAPALPALSDPETVTEPATAVALKAMEPFIAAVEAVEAPVEELVAEVNAVVEAGGEAAVEATPEPATFIAEPPEPVAGPEPASEAPRPRRKAAAQPSNGMTIGPVAD